MGGEAAAHLAFPKSLGDAVEGVPPGRGLGAVVFIVVISVDERVGGDAVGGGRVVGIHRCCLGGKWGNFYLFVGDVIIPLASALVEVVVGKGCYYIVMVNNNF